jgi:hypothetical protein
MYIVFHQSKILMIIIDECFIVFTINDNLYRKIFIYLFIFMIDDK